tara:strand:- start:291 stop:443 length:153 start_codon:yes stop_codon:yes gene_type:complete
MALGSDPLPKFSRLRRIDPITQPSALLSADDDIQTVAASLFNLARTKTIK